MSWHIPQLRLRFRNANESIVHAHRRSRYRRRRLDPRDRPSGGVLLWSLRSIGYRKQDNGAKLHRLEKFEKPPSSSASRGCFSGSRQPDWVWPLPSRGGRTRLVWRRLRLGDWDSPWRFIFLAEIVWSHSTACKPGHELPPSKLSTKNETENTTYFLEPFASLFPSPFLSPLPCFFPSFLP